MATCSTKPNAVKKHCHAGQTKKNMIPIQRSVPSTCKFQCTPGKHVGWTLQSLSDLPALKRKVFNHEPLYDHLCKIAPTTTSQIVVRWQKPTCSKVLLCHVNVQELRNQGFSVTYMEHFCDTCTAYFAYKLDWADAEYGLALELRVVFEEAKQRELDESYRAAARENLTEVMWAVRQRAVAYDTEPFRVRVGKELALEWVRGLTLERPSVELVTMEPGWVTLRLNVDAELLSALPQDLPRELQSLALDFALN